MKGGIRGMLERNNYRSVDMFFPFLAAFVDRCVVIPVGGPGQTDNKCLSAGTHFLRLTSDNRRVRPPLSLADDTVHYS